MLFSGNFPVHMQSLKDVALYNPAHTIWDVVVPHDKVNSVVLYCWASTLDVMEDYIQIGRERPRSS